MNKKIILLALFLMTGCASAPYKMPLLEKQVQQFPQQFDLSKKLYLDLAIRQDSDPEKTASEQKENRVEQIQSGLISILMTIYSLPNFEFTITKVNASQDENLCENSFEKSTPALKTLCSLTGSNQINLRTSRIFQDGVERSLTPREIVSDNLDKLIFHPSGILEKEEETSGRSLPILTLVDHPCLDNTDRCKIFTPVPSTYRWREQDWLQSQTNQQVRKVIWRPSEYENGHQGFYLSFLNLITANSINQGDSDKLPLPILTNIQLSKFFSENVPLISRHKSEELDKNFRQQLYQLGFDKYFDQPIKIHRSSLFDAINGGFSGHYLQGKMSNLIPPHLGKEEINILRQELWGMILVGYSKIESQKTEKDIKYVRVSVDIPKMLAEIAVKPRKYLLTSDYEKEYQNNIVDIPSGDVGDNIIRWIDKYPIDNE